MFQKSNALVNELERHALVVPSTENNGTHSMSNYVERKLFVHDGGEWPEQTREPCAYDLHHFSTRPCGVPQAYNEKTRRYMLSGFYCSTSCAYSAMLRDTLPHRVRNMQTWFVSFYTNVLHVRRDDIREAAPLELLVKMCAISPSSNDDDAVRKWRAIVRPPTLHLVPGMFIRVAQVYEQHNQRERTNLRQAQRATLMQTQRPKPVVLTKSGQSEQMKYVKRKISGQTLQTRGALDSMLGIKRTKH